MGISSERGLSSQKRRPFCRSASTSRPACVYVLCFPVKNHKTAILVYTGYIKSVFFEHKLTQKPAADKTEVSRQNHIVI